MPQILTANRLIVGEVVYWNESKGWVSRLEEARVLADSEAEGALLGAAAAVRNQKVVAPYLFKVRVEGERIVPVAEREVIRAAGPTVRPYLGKQAA